MLPSPHITRIRHLIHVSFYHVSTLDTAIVLPLVTTGLVLFKIKWRMFCRVPFKLEIC